MALEKRTVENARLCNESTILEDMQEPVLNCYEYSCNNVKKYGALNETAKALKLCPRYAERIVERGEIIASKEENMKKT